MRFKEKEKSAHYQSRLFFDPIPYSKAVPIQNH